MGDGVRDHGTGIVITSCRGIKVSSAARGKLNRFSVEDNNKCHKLKCFFFQSSYHGITAHPDSSFADYTFQHN